MEALGGDYRCESEGEGKQKSRCTLLHQHTTKLCRNRAETEEGNLHVFCATHRSYEDPSNKKRLHQHYFSACSHRPA